MYKKIRISVFFCLVLFVSFFACEKPPVEPVKIEYTLSATNLNFEVIGGVAEFTVEVKSPATIDSVKSLNAWCWVSSDGISPVNVRVTVSPNTIDAAPRNTLVVIYMKSGDTETSATVQISQNGEKCVLINGIRWASRNVDTPGRFTAKPEDAGMLYQWNRRAGWSATDPMISSDGVTTWNYFGAIGETWEKVNNPCPSGWRVPTTFELHSLAAANNKWTTQNGVNGRLFGSDESLLFLPAVGNRNHNSGAMGNANTHGHYWSNSINDANVYYLYFHSADILPNIIAHRAYGFSVRCVQE